MIDRFVSEAWRNAELTYLLQVWLRDCDAIEQTDISVLLPEALIPFLDHLRSNASARKLLGEKLGSHPSGDLPSVERDVVPGANNTGYHSCGCQTMAQCPTQGGCPTKSGCGVTGCCITYEEEAQLALADNI